MPYQSTLGSTLGNLKLQQGQREANLRREQGQTSAALYQTYGQLGQFPEKMVNTIADWRDRETRNQYMSDLSREARGRADMAEREAADTLALESAMSRHTRPSAPLMATGPNQLGVNPEQGQAVIDWIGAENDLSGNGLGHLVPSLREVMNQSVKSVADSKRSELLLQKESSDAVAKLIWPVIFGGTDPTHGPRATDETLVKGDASRGPVLDTMQSLAGPPDITTYTGPAQWHSVRPQVNEILQGAGLPSLPAEYNEELLRDVHARALSVSETINRDSVLFGRVADGDLTVTKLKGGLEFAVDLLTPVDDPESHAAKTTFIANMINDGVLPDSLAPLLDSQNIWEFGDAEDFQNRVGKLLSGTSQSAGSEGGPSDSTIALATYEFADNFAQHRDDYAAQREVLGEQPPSRSGEWSEGELGFEWREEPEDDSGSASSEPATRFQGDFNINPEFLVDRPSEEHQRLSRSYNRSVLKDWNKMRLKFGLTHRMKLPVLDLGEVLVLTPDGDEEVMRQEDAHALLTRGQKLRLLWDQSWLDVMPSLLQGGEEMLFPGQ